MKPRKPFTNKFAGAGGSGAPRGRGGVRGRGAGPNVARGGAAAGRGRGSKPKSINRLYPRPGNKFEHDDRHQEPEIIELDSEPDSSSNVFQQAQQQFNSSQSHGSNQDLRSVLNKRR